jgi:multidrug efflux pump
MYFTDIFIKRPVFASVLSLIILLVGIRSFFELTLRQYPNIQPSVITITTTYPGANAQLMEGFVTTPIENALGGIDGIDFINSSSAQGQSEISIHFKIGYNLNTAMADVSNAVSSAQSDLPEGINAPVIAKKDPSANPIIFIAFSSPHGTYNAQALTDFILRVVKPQMESLPGVSSAEVFGAGQYAMRIWLDPQRMAAQGVTATDLRQALNTNNVQSAPGLVEAPYQEINITAQTDLNTPEQFNDLVVRNNNGYLTRVKDIGHAELGPENNDFSINIGGNKNVVVVGIVPQPTANSLDVAKAVNALMPSIQASLPNDMEAAVAWDTSKFIIKSLSEVRKTIIEATICVAIVIFLFLGSIRAVIIPLVTIPLSLIGVCALMLILGYTINTLTLLAWVLAIGLVVDDAIVVAENIHRHIEAGQKPFEAAVLGAREISFAVIAMTFTLASVYAPIGFQTDITGKLFREFAFTLASAVIVSGFIALTLSPMLASKLLNHDTNKKGLPGKIDDLFNRLMARYKSLLIKIINHRIIVLLVALIVYIIGGIAFATLHDELAPNEDQGYFLAVINGPTSANLPYIEKYANAVADILKKNSDIINYGLINGLNGVNTSFAFAVLKPWEDRTKTAGKIIQEVTPAFMQLPGVLAFPFNPQPLPGAGGNTPVEFVLKTTDSYENLNKATQELIALASKNTKLMNLDTDLKLDKPQININIDRSKANALGVSMSDIGDSLNIFMGQPTTTHFEMKGRGYDVIPELYPQYMNNPLEVPDLNVRTTNGQLIPLSNFVQINAGATPKSLNHFQQIRAATITANLAPGYTLGQALNFLRDTAEKNLPTNISYDYSGQSRQFIQASGSMGATFAFALIFIYLILAAQFESFLDPLIVMFSVPLALTGALLTLHLVGATLNIYTQIGLITLVGLISKHGILMVEFANQLQEKGRSSYEAIIEAAALRLRPILMTTGAMLLGALPLVMATGAGAASRSQLGWTVFGGMAFGTLLTLFVVPTAYTLFALLLQLLRRWIIKLGVKTNV